MPTTKRTSKRKSHKGAVPVLGAVGMSLSFAGGASAAVVPPVDLPSPSCQRITKSLSTRRNSLTLVWRRSISSTKKTGPASGPIRPTRLQRLWRL